MQKINFKARHKARVLTLQAVYQWQFTGDTPTHILAQFHADTDMQKIDTEFFTEVLKGVVREVGVVDAQMEPVLDRPLSDLNPVELAVLRIAIYELMYRIDVPYKVVVNEALELTKLFGAPEGFKYVNGVLDKLARQLRSTEISAP